MDLVLLTVTVKGCSALSKFLAFVGKEFLLVVETVGDVAIVVSLVLDHTIKEVLVLGLGCSGVKLVLEVRILLEHSLTFVIVADNLLRLEHTDCALLDVEFNPRFGRADSRLVTQFRTIQLHRVSRSFTS